MTDLTDQERALLALIKANPFADQQSLAAALGMARSTVASHITQLITRGHIVGRGYVLPERQRLICIGGATLNRKYKLNQPAIMGTSNPATGYRNFGGVSRNVAENLARLGAAVALLSVVGEDESGRALLRQLQDIGVDVSQTLVTSNAATAEYAAVLDPGKDLIMGIADMQAFDLITPSLIDKAWPHLSSASWVFVDCNPTAEALAELFQRKRSGAKFKLAADTVSVHKAQRLPRDLTGLDVLFTNVDEARALLGDGHSAASAAEIGQQLVARGAAAVIITQGAQGHLVVTRDQVTLVPAIEIRPVDVTGAGDSLIAGTLLRLLGGEDLVEASRTGALVAALTVESATDVHPLLSEQLLADNAHRLSGLAPQRIMT